MTTSAAHSPPDDRPERLPVFAMATSVLVVVVGGSFAVGWLMGRILL